LNNYDNISDNDLDILFTAAKEDKNKEILCKNIINIVNNINKCKLDKIEWY
jgi:hypothetical protein